MANTYGTQMTKLVATPPTTPAPGFVHGNVHCFNESITLAAQAAGDTITVARMLKGFIPLFGIIYTTVTFGATATIAIGVSGTAGKYRTAATFTTADVPTFFGNTAAMGVALTADEDVIVTIAAAALPGSGTFRVQFFYAFD